jgi:cytidylate kinase
MDYLMTFIVAMDGPAGTGKSSVARSIAKELGFVYVDTGAIYRALAYLAKKFHIDSFDADAVLTLVPKIKLVIDDEHTSKIQADGQLLDAELRDEEFSRLSSVVSQHPKVRQALLSLQRNFPQKNEEGAIIEGRDIGTVVFPDADVKIFISANSETRALRRHQELLKIGQQASFEEVHDAIRKRDERDKNRSNAPMQKATDAIIIDTSDMTLSEVIDHTLGIVKKSLAQRGTP